MTPNPLLLQTEQRHTTLLKSTLLAKVLFMHPPSKKLCRRSYANRSSASKRSADNSNARNTLLTKGTAPPLLFTKALLQALMASANDSN